jgi:hypothetical protein
MQKNALICTKAMGVHNAILRAAVSTHAGHVIEQEGDSWSVAFHRPVEAVAFCLQVKLQIVDGLLISPCLTAVYVLLERSSALHVLPTDLSQLSSQQSVQVIQVIIMNLPWILSKHAACFQPSIS